MSPGAIEEAGETARSAIDSLKSTPVVLALVIFNVLYMGGSVWSQVKQGETYDRAAERWKGLTETAMRYCNMQPQVESTPPGKKWVLQSDESTPVELPPLPQARPPEADK